MKTSKKFSRMVDTSGPEIVAALDQLCDATPKSACAFYCKQDKDRTGLLAMFALHCGGAAELEIITDSHKSDSMRRAAHGGGTLEEKSLQIDSSRSRARQRR